MSVVRAYINEGCSVCVPPGWSDTPAPSPRTSRHASFTVSGAGYNVCAARLQNTGVQGGVTGVYLLRMDTVIFTGGGVQYQQLRNDTGGSPTGWMDFISCCLEAAATPLLDLQSDPAIQGYWPGLEQIVIRDCA